MARGGKLLSKKFIKNALIVLAIVAVAYFVMRGVKEGFQTESTTEVYVKGTNTIALAASEYKDKGSLVGANFEVWGNCYGVAGDAGKKWVPLSSLPGGIMTSFVRQGGFDTGPRFEVKGGPNNTMTKIKISDLTSGKVFPGDTFNNSFVLAGFQGTSGLAQPKTCTTNSGVKSKDIPAQDAIMKVTLKFKL